MKKLFTLLTLALISIGSAWGEYRTILMYDATDDPATTTPAGATVTLTGVSTNATGVQFIDAITAEKYIKVTLPTGISLAANDQIVITQIQGGTSSPNNTYGSYVTATTSTSVLETFKLGIPNSQGKNSGDAAYTVTVGDGIVGSSSFYVRGFSPSSTKSMHVQKIEVKQYYVDSRSGLTLSFSPEGKNIGISEVLSTTLSWSEDTSGEDGKYTTTYSSSNESIATVDATGKITGVAEGTATITVKVTAAADATYKTTTASITVNVKVSISPYANTAIPSATLNLSDADEASTMINKAWSTTYGYPLFGKEGVSNYLTFSFVSAYESTGTQTWVGKYSSGSTGQSWEATDVFKGSAAYMSSSARAATTKSSAGIYSFRVKGVSKVQALVSARNSSQKVVMAAYEYSGSTPASTTMLYDKNGSGNDIITLTLDLNISKEYLITISADGTTTNSRLYEMALFYDEAVTLYEAVTPTKEYTTYVTTNAVDFTGLGVKGYIATAASASSVTLEEVTKVPAKTPLVLKGTASTEYKLPVCATVAAPASNLLKAGDGTTSIGGDGNYDYILSDGKFYHASPAGPVAVGKAYLHLATAPSDARMLEIDIDGISTGINMVNGEGLKVNGSETYYDLQGRRVLYPTKGLYIVNGKKVVIK